MSDPIMPAPSLILETKDDVHNAVLNKSRVVWEAEPYAFSWRIKSLWIISLIDEIEAEGHYPYNSVVKRRAEQEMGFPARPQRDYSVEGDTLSLLIYNAQCYRDSDRLIAEGFSYGTTETLTEAYRSHRKIELRGGTRLTVREVDGKLFAFKPRMRKYATDVIGVPVRLT